MGMPGRKQHPAGSGPDERFLFAIPPADDMHRIRVRRGVGLHHVLDARAKVR